LKIAQPIAGVTEKPRPLPLEATSALTPEGLRGIGALLAEGRLGAGALAGISGAARPPSAFALGALGISIDWSRPLLLSPSLLGAASRITLPAPPPSPSSAPSTPAASSSKVSLPVGGDWRILPIPQKALENAYHGLNAAQLGLQTARGVGWNIPHGSQIDAVGDTLVAGVVIGLMVDELTHRRIKAPWKRFAFFVKHLLSVVKAVFHIAPASPTIKRAVDTVCLIVKAGDEIYAVQVRPQTAD
jgi:hypothetical protein